ncbi:hypothetical protein MMC25_005277 [Agyrium rufum]|nr:hypothetical protein [Agyrium rufum]
MSTLNELLVVVDGIASYLDEDLAKEDAELLAIEAERQNVGIVESTSSTGVTTVDVQNMERIKKLDARKKEAKMNKLVAENNIYNLVLTRTRMIEDGGKDYRLSNEPIWNRGYDWRLKECVRRRNETLTFL